MRRSVFGVALVAGLAAACGTHESGFTAARADDAAGQLYAKECGGCHMPFPPPMLPARSWHALMSGLDKHFGENASLDPQAARTIASYLAANAGDTRGARTMEGLGPNDVPLRITETPFWIDAHEEVSPARFASPKVKSKSNCLACHSDKGEGGDDD
jgi:mono/diheme cytochrome c family protein